MSKLGYFLGGLLAGAAGLVGATLLHGRLRSSGAVGNRVDNKCLDGARVIDVQLKDETEQSGASNAPDNSNT